MGAGQSLDIGHPETGVLRISANLDRVLLLCAHLINQPVPKSSTYDARVSDDCLFCRIVAGEIPATIVHETGSTVAFRDVNPQAPTHVVVVARAHHADAASL